MEKLNKFLIALFTLFILTSNSCGENKDCWNCAKEDVIVLDSKGNKYMIVTISGCEFYKSLDGKIMVKADCDCKPKKQ